jgi:hypothetical protein
MSKAISDALAHIRADVRTDTEALRRDVEELRRALDVLRVSLESGLAQRDAILAPMDRRVQQLWEAVTAVITVLNNIQPQPCCPHQQNDAAKVARRIRYQLA